MDSLLKEMRDRIRAIGVAEVARRARVPATTLYSFCQHPDRELSFSTGIVVAQALEVLEADDRRASAISGGLAPAGMSSVSVVPQSDTCEQMFDRVGRAIGDERRWFDTQWLESIAPQNVPLFCIVVVTEKGMSPLLQPGDQVLMNRAPIFTSFRQAGVFLIKWRDGVRFVRCERVGPKGSKRKYTYQMSTKASAAAIEVAPSQIIGRALWVGRSLVDADEPVAALAAEPAPAKSKRGRTSRS